MPRSKNKTHANTASAEDVSTFIQQIRLTGRSRGLVKNLSGFNKKHHSVPDAVNAHTAAFLSKLCTDELAEEAEAFFQKARTLFAYKRKEIALDLSSSLAVLTAHDFTLEWSYALAENAPSEWLLTRTLHTLNSAPAKTPEANTAHAAAFEEAFAGMFDTIIFSLTKGAPVESIIDAVESLDAEPDGNTTLNVTYPSDYSRCVLTVEGVAAEVVFDGGELSMVFPRAGSPSELIAAFAEVRRAFALAKISALSALL